MLRTNTARWLKKQNRWHIQVQKDGIRKAFYSSTPGRKGQREANAKADKWLKGINPVGLTCKKMIDRFLSEEEAFSKSMYVQHESIMRLYVIPKIGRKKTNALTAQDLQDCINAMYKKGLSKRSLKNARDCISAFLKYARKSQALFLTADDIHIPKNAVCNEKQTLSDEALKILFNDDTTLFRGEVTKDWFINFYRLVVITGLRRGEAAGLEWGDINNQALRIKRSVNRFNEVTKGKNKNAIREIRLSTTAADILKTQRQMLLKNGIGSKRVFPMNNGAYARPNYIYTRWSKYIDYHGIDHVSLYELRHTFVTLCQGKINEDVVKDLVGHSKNMDTFGTYGHGVSIEVLDQANKTIDKIYKKYKQSK